MFSAIDNPKIVVANVVKIARANPPDFGGGGKYGGIIMGGGIIIGGGPNPPGPGA
jgi:hypothetical protein